MDSRDQVIKDLRELIAKQSAQLEEQAVQLKEQAARIRKLELITKNCFCQWTPKPVSDRLTKSGITPVGE